MARVRVITVRLSPAEHAAFRNASWVLRQSMNLLARDAIAEVVQRARGVAEAEGLPLDRLDPAPPPPLGCAEGCTGP